MRKVEDMVPQRGLEVVLHLREAEVQSGVKLREGPLPMCVLTTHGPERCSEGNDLEGFCQWKSEESS